MPASSLAQILLRIFALYWLMSGIIQFGHTAFMTQGITPDFLFFLSSFIYVLLGLALWFLAPRLSRVAARGNDGELTLRGVTERQLCATAFIVLGVYFALTNVGPVVNGIYLYVLKRNHGDEQFSGNYEFLKFVINLVAGVLLAGNARKLAAKLYADKPAVEQED